VAVLAQEAQLMHIVRFIPYKPYTAKH